MDVDNGVEIAVVGGEDIRQIKGNGKNLKNNKFVTSCGGEKEWIPAETQASLRFHGPFSFTNATIFIILYSTTEHCHIC